MTTNLVLVLALLLVGSSFAADRAPRYQDYTVTNGFKGKPPAVDLSSHSEARRFRTQLRRQTAEGANFAGHYRLVIWGCGTSCAQFAIVDCKTGHAYFSADLPYVTWTGWDGGDFGLQFRVDSRLLILCGSPQEEAKRGRFYYLWETNTLRLIRSDLKK